MFLRRLLLCLLGGAMYALPFVEPSLGPAAFIGMAPAVLVLTFPGKAPSLLGTVGWAWVASAIATFLVALPLQKISPVAILIQGGIVQLWPWAMMVAFAWIHRRTGWPIALLWPCCWVIAEWGWSYHSVGSLAFGLSGYTLFRLTPLIQIADLGGVLLVSATVQMVVGAIVDVIRMRLEGKRPWRAAVMPLAVSCGVVGTAALYGSIRLLGAKAEPGPQLALIQPAVPHSLDEATVRMVQAKQIGLARERVGPGEVDLVVFPENAVLQSIEGSPYLDEFKQLSRDLRAPILAGVSTRTDENLERWKKGLPPVGIRVGRMTYRYGHNTAAIIEPGGLTEKYRKRHLMPFSEQLPGQPLFAALGRLHNYQTFIASVLGYVGAGIPGKETRLLSVPGTNYPRYWTPICFEQADARLSREASLLGARYFINITSEGDLGPQIYWNTVAVCALRAAELHVGIARAGNMGITGIIDPWGRIRELLRDSDGSLWGMRGVLKARALLGPEGPTVYARLGDWPAGAALLGIAIALLTIVRRKLGF